MGKSLYSADSRDFVKKSSVQGTLPLSEKTISTIPILTLILSAREKQKLR